jgi:RNA polymerase sigma factor (sigma-70 family)
LEQEVWRRLLPYLRDDRSGGRRLFGLVHAIERSVVRDFQRTERTRRSREAPTRQGNQVDGRVSTDVERLPDLGPDPLVLASRHEREELIRRFKDYLPARQHFVLDRVFVYDESLSKIAVRLKVSVATVCRDLQRACRSLSTMLRDP